MAHLEFAPALQRHVVAPPMTNTAGTLRSLLAAAFAQQPSLQGYVLDDQGRVRKHVAVFINGSLMHDRQQLDVPLTEDDRIYIAQALSGG